MKNKKLLKKYKLINNFRSLSNQQWEYIEQYFYNEYMEKFQEKYPEYANLEVNVELDTVPVYDICIDWLDDRDWNLFVYFVVEDNGTTDYIRVADLWIPHKTTKSLDQLLKEHVEQICYN